MCKVRIPGVFVNDVLEEEIMSDRPGHSVVRVPECRLSLRRNGYLRRTRSPIAVSVQAVNKIVPPESVNGKVRDLAAAPSRSLSRTSKHVRIDR